MNWLYLLGVVVFVVGLLVAIGLHEIGHMVPAKRFGVKVTQYMIGFGPTAWSRKVGDTEYGIKWIPLGGYIRMIGMFPPGKDGKIRSSSTGPIRSMIDEARAVSLREVGPGDEDRVFYRKPWWQKVIVMTGGPFMNFVQAFVLFAIVLMGFGVATLNTTVASVPECVVPVAEAEALTNPTTGELECRPTDPASPAAEAGLRPGDEILSVAGVAAADWETVSSTIRAHADETVDVVVKRDGEQLTLSAALITSERPSVDDPDVLVAVGYLGIAPSAELVEQPISAVPAQMWEFTKNTAIAIISIPQRMEGVWDAAFGGGEREIDGPIGIVGAGRIGGEFVASDSFATQEKVASMLALLASLNMALGVFNLLPLLPLDGGHIAGALYEAARRGVARLRRRPDPGYFDVAKLLPVAYAVAILVISMSALLLYADIVNPVRLSL